MELGRNNQLIWHFKEDMAFFKETTTGSCVIMGRKTFESLPKALPRRKNIVISSNPDYLADNAFVVPNVDAALKEVDTDKAFIIGGGNVYQQFLPLADVIYLTEIEAACPDADTYFPNFNKSNFDRQVIASYYDNSVHFSHVCYRKK